MLELVLCHVEAYDLELAVNRPLRLVTVRAKATKTRGPLEIVRIIRNVSFSHLRFLISSFLFFECSTAAGVLLVSLVTTPTYQLNLGVKCVL